MPKILRLLAVLFFLPTNNFTVSLVYNLRIAETTKRQKIKLPEGRPSIGSIAIIDQERKRYDGHHQRVTGGVGTLLYTPDRYYIRMDFGAAHVSEAAPFRTCSKTESDDIVFTAGKGFSRGEQVKFAFSGIVGFPTHTDHSLQRLQCGTGHIGLGGQFDGSYTFLNHSNHKLLGALRFLHFFPRTAPLAINNTCRFFDVHLGNLFDILIAHNAAWGRHRLEYGYNPSTAFSVAVCPPLPGVRSSGFAVRNNFYASYFYGFKIRHHLSGIICGLSYGFDYPRLDAALKHVVTTWFAWGVNF